MNVKTAEQLYESGGRFYNVDSEMYCDCTTSSYKYVEGVGYVRLMDNGRLPVELRTSDNMSRMRSILTREDIAV